MFRKSDSSYRVREGTYENESSSFNRLTVTQLFMSSLSDINPTAG